MVNLVVHLGLTAAVTSYLTASGLKVAAPSCGRTGRIFVSFGGWKILIYCRQLEAEILFGE